MKIGCGLKKVALAVVFGGVAGLGLNSSVFSLSYQQDIGVSFTFNPSIQIVLTASGCGSTASEAKLCINNLAPGTVADSNIVNINVLSNTGNGYTLNATVGSNTVGGGRFVGRELVHTSTSVSNTFSSLNTNANLASNTDFNDNEWGYTYSLDDGATWINANKTGDTNNTGYSGLPLYSDTSYIATLNSTNGPSTNDTGDNIKFKIAAKASTTQPSGEYNNIINFTVTAQPMPVTLYMAYENAGKEKHNGYFKMQDMSAEICNAADVVDEDSQMQAIDIRDDKVYWITKLQDGKCWMTQNLDLNLSDSVSLTSETTDLTYYGDNGYDSANGYTKSGDVISWTPMRATINAVTDENTSGAITGWMNDANTPYSVDTGNYYWKNTPFYYSQLCRKTVDGGDFQGCNYITKADSDWVNYFSTTSYQSNGTHGHVGNYYNWSAAVASNNTSSYTTSTFDNPNNNPQNSICPAGWRLPIVTSASPTYGTQGSRDEFSRLAYLYDNYTGNTSISSEGLEKAPLYIVRSGLVRLSLLLGAGYEGGELSSTMNTSNNILYLNFVSSLVYPQHVYANTRVLGYPIRCLAR